MALENAGHPGDLEVPTGLACGRAPTICGDNRCITIGSGAILSAVEVQLTPMAAVKDSADNPLETLVGSPKLATKGRLCGGGNQGPQDRQLSEKRGRLQKSLLRYDLDQVKGVQASRSTTKLEMTICGRVTP